MSFSRLLTIAALCAVLPAAASAHPAGPVAPDTDYQWGEEEKPTYSEAMSALPEPAFEAGPCTEAARQSMPAGEGHDHLDPLQHQFACGMVQVAFDSLQVELAERPDVTLGEMDVKGDLAVVAVAYPESGFLLFDVSNPAQPGFLSWYRSAQCEGVAVDVDCGAFVDLSPDGQYVFISKQQISAVHTSLGTEVIGTLPADYPGIEVVDISNRKRPLLRQALPQVSVGGVHTTRSFEVPANGGPGPREPGTYTVSVANSVGASINKVGPGGVLTPVGLIEMDELHDTFIQQDPILDRTLLYIAGGFDSGFYVFDITAPSNPVGLGEWDITPECENDWYAHTIDVTTVEGRRIVTMPVELIDFFGTQSEEDQAEGCGVLQGNGDHAGPLFVVDATDFSKLGPIDTTDSEEEETAGDVMKQRSEETLITTWSNAAGRAGGELTFSAHNQQIVGDKIYLSGYHSGVTVLDASKAFRGENIRPRELAFAVPSNPETRPIAEDQPGVVLGQFFTSFIDYRPLIWDMTFHKGYVLVPDMTGGMSSYQETKAGKRKPRSRGR
jgi:hypothetical protein